MKKILIVLGVAVLMCGCASSHKCGIEAAKTCGVDNVSYSMKGVFWGCSYKCKDYSKFINPNNTMETTIPNRIQITEEMLPIKTMTPDGRIKMIRDGDDTYIFNPAITEEELKERTK